VSQRWEDEGTKEKDKPDSELRRRHRQRAQRKDEDDKKGGKERASVERRDEKMKGSGIMVAVVVGKGQKQGQKQG
jgi:hypothetical protein